MTINEYKKQAVRSNTQNGLDENIHDLAKNAGIEQQVDDNEFKRALKKNWMRLIPNTKKYLN